MEEFEGRISAEVRRQEKLDKMEEKDFRRGELSGKYMIKMLYRWYYSTKVWTDLD